MPSKAVTALISISSFCLIKQQKLLLKTNPAKLTSRMAKYILRAFKQAYRQLIVSRYSTVVTQ